MEGNTPLPELPRKRWSLSRVSGPSLDPQKHWYILTRQLCGTRPTDFAKNEVFRCFPDEIRSVATRELRPATSECTINRQPPSVYVASSFGLCAGLLRHREIPKDGFVMSSRFTVVQNSINGIVLDADATTFGGKSTSDAVEQNNLQMQLANRESQIKKLERELQELKKEISDLECAVSDLKKQNLNCSTPVSSPSCSPSSTSTASSDCSTTSIEETLNSSLGSTTKKRRVTSQCRKVITSLDDVCSRYQESIACVLGNFFIFGNQEERDQVKDTVSEILNVAMDAKGSKGGLSELLSPDTYQRIVDGMRVPDWVLLYFKLQAKIPDAAWQTLLNLTHLGRSGVCIHILYIFPCGNSVILQNPLTSDLIIQILPTFDK